MEQNNFRQSWEKIAGNLEDLDQTATYGGQEQQSVSSPLPIFSINASERATADCNEKLPETLEIQSPVENTSTNYEILEEIARGGMGVIFQGYQNNLERNIAIKKMVAISESKKQKFIAEAKITAFLDHPNIVPVYDIGVNNSGEVFLAMKLVKGISWKELLYPKKPQEKKRAEEYDFLRHLEILLNVCNAMEFAHSKKIVHNDLKPANIMVGEFGEVLVMDWGLAVDINKKPLKKHLTHKSTIIEPMGTPSYMPAELAEGRGVDIGPWTDVYLLGAILYELLMKKPPHNSQNLWMAILSSTQGKLPEFSEDVPEELQKICHKSLAKNPKDRYQQVSAFRDALRQFLQHRESLVISQKAQKIFEQVKEIQAGSIERNQVYAQLSQAVALFEQSLELWSQNKKAAVGKEQIHIYYTSLALKNDDVGLAASLVKALETKKSATQTLMLKIKVAQRVKDRNKFAFRLALAALFFVILGVIAFFAWERYKQEKMCAKIIADGSDIINDTRFQVKLGYLKKYYKKNQNKKLLFSIDGKKGDFEDLNNGFLSSQLLQKLKEHKVHIKTGVVNSLVITPKENNGWLIFDNIHKKHFLIKKQKNALKAYQISYRDGYNYRQERSKALRWLAQIKKDVRDAIEKYRQAYEIFPRYEYKKLQAQAWLQLFYAAYFIENYDLQAEVRDEIENENLLTKNDYQQEFQSKIVKYIKVNLTSTPEKTLIYLYKFEAKGPWNSLVPFPYSLRFQKIKQTSKENHRAILLGRTMEEAFIGESPFSMELPEGSYLFFWKKTGYNTVRSLLKIDSNQKENIKLEIKLPKKDPIFKDFVYIPRTAFLAGGEMVGNIGKRWEEAGPVLIRKKEVTFGEYFAFLQDFIDQAQNIGPLIQKIVVEKRRRLKKHNLLHTEENRQLQIFIKNFLYRKKSGYLLPNETDNLLKKQTLSKKVHFSEKELAKFFIPLMPATFRWPIFRYSNKKFVTHPVWKMGKKKWRLWPIYGVTRNACEIYILWLSVKHKRHYRLPTELEWELAARGADGRMFSWGNFLWEKAARRNGGYGAFQLTYEEMIERKTADVSPWGILDLAGSMAEWTDSVYEGSRNIKPHFTVKGNLWGIAPEGLKCGFRVGETPFYFHVTLGFRLAVQVSEK